MSQRTGPSSYENWRHSDAAANGGQLFEYPFYSDAIFTSELLEGAGPYVLLNSVPVTRRGAFGHALTLRFRLHTNNNRPDLSKTDTANYHGGWIPEEISAIVGLLVGVRLRAGGTSREFFNDDPLGRPRAGGEPAPPLLPYTDAHWKIPRARGTHDISQLSLLSDGFISLSPAQASALVRSARLYQDALWFAEAQPELAWLLFVSALEVVATLHHVEGQAPEEALRRWNSELYDLLAKASDPGLLIECANRLSSQTRVTTRFVQFVLDFFPEAPPRPSDAQHLIRWSKSTIRTAMSSVYNHRSAALHDGTPFPRPMCESPFAFGSYAERPVGLATGSLGSSWLHKDTPMLLHVFEHICRSSICRWWKSAMENSLVAPSS